jgi:signal transduction histidine kinase
MLLNLENFKTDEVGHLRVVGEITELQESTRDALRTLRDLLYDLRGPTGVEEGFTQAVCGLLGRHRNKPSSR